MLIDPPITPNLDSVVAVTRRGDCCILQALSLLIDKFVMDRTRASGTGPTASLLAANLGLTDVQVIQNFYLAVLSRYPTTDEKNTAITQLQSGNRAQQIQDLLWSLSNKLDFIYNY